MKNKSNDGRDFTHRYRTSVIANIGYSAFITCLVEVLVISNLNILSYYVIQSSWENTFFRSIYETEMATVIGYVIFGIVLFSVIFFLLQERSLKYITKISDGMKNISEGDLNTLIEIDGDDEFSSMAENLNKMVEEIRSLMEKERESERTKNELITNVAHDLRTPLTSIIGYMEILSAKKLPEEMQKKYIDIAYTKAKRLEKLIEDLFGFTKLNYGKISMDVSEIDIVKLLGQLLEEAYPSFSANGISYELKTNINSQIINADGNLLARLFDNLINNAIKYGAEGKRVIVTIHSEENVVVVAVRNFGYIIPQKELDLIFDKFYRVEQSRSTHTGGTGLGLAISKNIVDMHGGLLHVKSDSDGTVFTVTLQVDFDINKEHFGRLKEE